MKRVTLACFMVISLGNGAFLHAQDSLVGTYSGRYQGAHAGVKNYANGVQLTITAGENGAVKGTMRVFISGNQGLGACGGNFPMEGAYADGKLQMKSIVKGGSAGDCSYGFVAVKDGNKLTGTMDSGETLTLSK